MSFTATIVCHNDAVGLVRAARMIAAQTVPADEVLIYASDVPESLTEVLGWPVTHVPNLDDWGHGKVRQSIQDASSEWIGWLNSDDEWTPWYIDYMLYHANPKIDLVFCPTYEIYHAMPQISYCTRGNYIARVSAARRVEYHSTYDADGRLTSDMVATGSGWIQATGPYHHNVRSA